MINTGLDKNFKAREFKDEGTQTTKKSYEPIPAGAYEVEVLEVEPWQSRIKDIYINLRGEDGRLLRDENGQTVRELHKGVEYYTANVKLKVVEGEHEGRWLFTSITTHPNASFITENFLYAIGQQELTASKIQDVASGSRLRVDVTIEKYDRKVTDQDTGLEKTEAKTKNEVKTFKKSVFEDYGI